MTSVTPFELNISEQPEALRRLAEGPTPDLAGLTVDRWDRFVLTGMGSSHFAAIPTWRALVRHGAAAWVVDTATLLGNLELVTPRTVLVITSQSGASGEIVELLRRLADRKVVSGVTVGVTNAYDSPLAREANVMVPLHSGPEATVSTKSYLNSLAVHQMLAVSFVGGDVQQSRDEIHVTANHIEKVLQDDGLVAATRKVREFSNQSVVYAAWGNEVSTARFAGLITKEAAKIPAEGFVGGQFRHGPLELAGDGLTAILFGLDEGASDSVNRLATDLVRTGAHVLVAGDIKADGVTVLPGAGRSTLQALTTGAVAAQRLSVNFAYANNVVPGAFVYGRKITTAL